MSLNARAADRIRVRWYELQDQYERFARELHRILDEDSRFPVEAVYTVKHRLKSQPRLLEKIADANDNLRKGTSSIDHNNFDDRVDDLLGIRVVSLRLSDLEKLRAYLESLRVENKLRFLKGPTEKKTFLIRPGDAEPAGNRQPKQDMQYSGYSSIHYVVKLGKSLRPPVELKDLKAELQLRTILEEAWGEIDHKYRYEFTRTGVSVPEHVSTGFRDLGLYLQAAARQADHLCEEVERLVLSRRSPRMPPRRSTSLVPAASPATTAPAVNTAPPVPATLPELFKSLLGFEPIPRTLSYCQRRLDEHAYHIGRQFSVAHLHESLTSERMDRFRQIYQEVIGHAPFQSPDERDGDLVPLINFGIFSSVQSHEASEAGLKASLRSHSSIQRWRRW